jgi:hypothetical protein
MFQGMRRDQVLFHLRRLAIGDTLLVPHQSDLDKPDSGDMGMALEYSP